MVKDTVYTYTDISKAKQALHLIDVMASDEFSEEHVIKMHHPDMDGKAQKHVIFMSGDGEMHEINEDGMEWVTTTTEEEGDSVKIYKIKIKGDSKMMVSGNAVYINEGDCDEKVFVNEEDGKVEVIVKKISKEDGKEKVEVNKEVIILSEDEEAGGEWTVKEGENGELIMTNADGNKVKVIKKMDPEAEGDIVKWNAKEGGEDMEVIVIKKAGSDDKDKMEVKVNIDDNEQDVKAKKEKKKTMK
jgi:hypothetical protein